MNRATMNMADQETVALRGSATNHLANAGTIEDQVADLEAMDLTALRRLWTERFGPAPRLRSAELLRFNLAWRIQAQAYGGLVGPTRRRLRRSGGGAGAAADQLEPGSRLVKDWKGSRYEVVVTREGFEHAGATWQSLSQIARTITGVRCNGPKFFGLRAVAERS